MENFLAAGPEVVEIVLARSGEHGHILGGGNLEMLDILLQVGDVDAEIIKGEGKVQDV